MVKVPAPKNQRRIKAFKTLRALGPGGFVLTIYSSWGQVSSELEENFSKAGGHLDEGEGKGVQPGPFPANVDSFP